MATKAPDYSSIALKLLEKTQAGKIAWEPGEKPFGTIKYLDRDEEDFRTGLAEGFGFNIARSTYRGDTTYTLSMKDNQGLTVFTLSLTDDPETIANQPQLYQTLDELYDAARRKAFKVDEKVERVSEILEKI
jgi:hypothetical protein